MGWPYQQKPPHGWPLDYDGGLVPNAGFWLCNEGSGNKVVNLIGNGNTGALTNGAVWVPGKFGSAIELGGDDEFIELGTIPVGHLLQLTSGGSVSFWMYHHGFGDIWQRIIDKSDGGSAANGWDINLGSTAQSSSRRITIIVGGGAPSGYDTDNEIYNLNTWTHVVCTFGAVGNHIYVNGVEVAGTQTTGSPINPPSAQTNARIGTWNHTTGREFDGLLDNIGVYDRILSASDSAKLHQYPFWMFKDPAEMILAAAGQTAVVGNPWNYYAQCG